MWRGRVSPPANACQGSIADNMEYNHYSEKMASLSVRLMVGRQQRENYLNSNPHRKDK